MSANDNIPSNANPDTSKEVKPPRKPYDPPRILSREPLEAMAATCTASARGKASTSVCGVARS